jgi:hypothetical protein
MRVDQLAHATDEEVYYAFDRALLSKHTALVEGIRPPNFLIKHESRLFMLGGPNSGAAFHAHADAWAIVLSGSKRWFIYSVGQSPPGGIPPAFSQLGWLQRVYARLSPSSRPHECVQHAGEIMYVPESFPHGVLNVGTGPTLAVSFQAVRASTDLQRLADTLAALEARILNGDNDASLGTAAVLLAQQLVTQLPRAPHVLFRLASAWCMAPRATVNASTIYSALSAVLEADPLFVSALELTGAVPSTECP